MPIEQAIEEIMRSFAYVPILALLIVGAAIAASCSTPDSRPGSVDIGAVASAIPPSQAESCLYMQVGAYRVWMPSYACLPDPLLKARIASAAKQHIEAFQRQESVACRRGDIVVTTFMPVLEEGHPLLGYYHQPETIVVWAGGTSELPALYHELCHMHLAEGDGDHKHEKWPLWEARCNSVASRIAGQHVPH